MKKLLDFAIIVIAFISALPPALAMDGDDLLTTAVRLRLQSVAPVVVDPDIIDLKLLSTPVDVDATTRPGALSQLKRELEPRGLTVTDQGNVVWITKREAERDLSRQIALIINTPSYRQLANLLAAEAKSSPDPRLQKLSEMATFMAEQSSLPAQTKAFIDAKSKAIKNLQFMQRNALSGSSLSAPDPTRAAALERDIEKHRQEVREHYDKLIGMVLASNFSPADPSTAPPAIFAVYDLIPRVLFNRIALDSMLAYVEAEEALLGASTALAFKKADTEDTVLLRARVDAINKAKTEIQDSLSRYMALLQRSGLIGEGAKTSSSRSSQLGVEAANQLLNVYGDTREAVRVAIGTNIIEQLEQISRRLSEDGSNLVLSHEFDTLYLFGESELESASKTFGQAAFRLKPYLLGSDGRVGAVSGLSTRGDTGVVRTRSVQLENRGPVNNSGVRSVDNVLADPERIVSLNATDGEATVDDSWVGSIGEAVDLIKSEYDPSLFKSRIILTADQNYDISAGGDSAGVSIALAILSRVRSMPVDRRLMVTGAVRQFGDVRPVGGIFEKGTAALDADALALLMPTSNLGEILSLPADKVLARHVISLSRFDEAASLAGLDVGEKSRPILEAVCLHNFAVMAAMAGKYPEALILVEKAVTLSPNHISAQILQSVLRAGSVKPAPSESVANLLEQSSAFANLLSTNPVAAGEKSTSTATAQPGSILGAVIPDFTVSGASGDEAFEALNNKARAAFGQPANITIRSKNEYFTTKFINLSIKNKTVSEILQQICDLCDAKFQQKGSAIVVDSMRAPVVAELSAVVIPDFTVQDKSAQEAFKHLADKAAEISGKPVNIVIDSKNNLFRTLSINLSLQRKTFKEILDQLCLICDATSEQRGDAFVVTTPN